MRQQDLSQYRIGHLTVPSASHKNFNVKPEHFANPNAAATYNANAAAPIANTRDKAKGEKLVLIMVNIFSIKRK